MGKAEITGKGETEKAPNPKPQHPEKFQAPNNITALRALSCLEAWGFGGRLDDDRVRSRHLLAGLGVIGDSPVCSGHVMNLRPASPTVSWLR